MSERTLWVVRAACLACFSVDGLAQPSDEPVFLERVLQFADENDATDLWERFIKSDFRVRSDRDGRHAFFEVNQQLEDVDRTRFHFVLDDNGIQRIQLQTSGQNIFDSILVDDRQFVFGKSAFWEKRDRQSWSFHIDNPHLPFDSKRRDIGKRGSVGMQPGQFLDIWLDSENPIARWDASTRTLEAESEAGRRAVVRFRTPNDQELFGSVLGEICALGTNGGHLSIRSIIVGVQSPLRININAIQSLGERLGAIPTGDVTVRNSFESVTSRREVRKLEHEFSLDLHDTRKKESAEFSTLMQQNVTMCLNFAALRLESDQDIPNVDEFVEFLVNELDLMYVSVVEQICKNRASAVAVLDDPNIISLGLERAIDGRPVGMLSNLVLRMLANDELSIGSKIRLCMTLGEFGPIFRAVPGDPDIAGLCHEGPFLEAILHARWGWPATADQLGLCRKKIADEWPYPNQHEAAVDSLVRWGRLFDVSEDARVDWFEHILDSTRMHQHCSVKALTRCESGRRFLLGRFDQLDGSPEFRTEAASILSSRARAALELKRFDFMTEDECRKTLRDCSRFTGEVRGDSTIDRRQRGDVRGRAK